MPQRDNIILFGGNTAVSRPISLGEKEQKVVNACRSVVKQALPLLLVGLFDKLDDALYELADKADNNALQSTYFMAMRDIRKERGRVEKEFNGNILGGYDRFWEGVSAKRTRDRKPQDGLFCSDLALVGDDELEESLAVNNMISKGENRYHRELFVLDQRFGALLNGMEVDNQVNPLAPAAFCNVFRDTIRSINTDIPVKLVVYKLFDKQVMHYVGGMYDEVNGLLEQAGVMPRLAPKIRPNPVAPGMHRQGTTQESVASGHGGGAQGRHPGEYAADEDEVQTEIFHALRQLLSARRGGLSSAQDTAGVASLPVVDTSVLLGALSVLQRTSIPMLQQVSTTPAMDVGAIKAQLEQQLGLLRNGEAQKAIGQTDDDTIDVIEMLFEFILEDSNIPDAMKVLLGRLQIPMLKLAIMDKSFFSKKMHPARRLLNNLAQAATGWSDGSEHRKDTLYQKIESIVSRVLVDFQDDPGAFSKLNAEFSEYLEKEKRGAEVTEERTTQVTRGKEQLKAAKHRVAHEIESRLSIHRNAPEVVHSLLQEGWKDVLLLSYLRQGPDSEAWRQGVELIDTLLWSIEPKTNHLERQELLKNIPELLRRLREGLTGISYDQHKMAHLLKELQACHIACLRGNYSGTGLEEKRQDGVALGDSNITASTAVTNMPGVLHSEDKPVGNHHGVSRTEQEPGRDSFIEAAEVMKVGVWLELQEQDGSKTRAKLSWKSDVSDAYVFVNRKGVKVAEMKMRELAAGLRQKRVKILDQVGVPLMDRALTSMMDNLQEREAGPGLA